MWRVCVRGAATNARLDSRLPTACLSVGPNYVISDTSVPIVPHDQYPIVSRSSTCYNEGKTRDAMYAGWSSFRYTECAYWLPGGVERVPCAAIVGLGEDDHYPALVVLSRKISRMKACSS